MFIFVYRTIYDYIVTILIVSLTTTILITKLTRNELKTRGLKGSTYDDIIQELLKK